MIQLHNPLRIEEIIYLGKRLAQDNNQELSHFSHEVDETRSKVFANYVGNGALFPPRSTLLFEYPLAHTAMGQKMADDLNNLIGLKAPA